MVPWSPWDPMERSTGFPRKALAMWSPHVEDLETPWGLRVLPRRSREAHGLPGPIGVVVSLPG